MTLARFSKAIPSTLAVLAFVVTNALVSGALLHVVNVAIAILTAAATVLAPENAKKVTTKGQGDG